MVDEIDKIGAAGMFAFAVMFGAFFGFVLTFGDLMGAVLGVVVFVVIAAIYVFKFSDVPPDESDTHAH